MYGDKLKQAIDTINEYLQSQSGNEIYLWDRNSDSPSLKLDEYSKLEFASSRICNYDIRKEIGKIGSMEDV